MQCETVREQLVDGVTGGAAGEIAAIEKHLSACPACSRERDSLAQVWERLGVHVGPGIDRTASARMRTRFDALLEAFDAGRHGARPGWRRYVAHAAAAVVILGLGFTVGRQTDAWQGAASDMVTMRQELQDLRHVVTLSLMQQPSATDRLKGVSWSGHIDAPSDDIVRALLDTLMRDPNVNVRLASIDALQRFAQRDAVRHAALEAVQMQMSPLVQIALIDFMVQANERNAVTILKQLADDPQVHETVRARASWGLQILG